MDSLSVRTVAGRSSARAADAPLAWLGADRLLLDDTSVYGLRRYVVAHKGEPPEVEQHLNVIESQHPQANVYAWCVEKDDGFWYLWIVWKEKA